MKKKAISHLKTLQKAREYRNTLAEKLREQEQQAVKAIAEKTGHTETYLSKALERGVSVDDLEDFQQTARYHKGGIPKMAKIRMNGIPAEAIDAMYMARSRLGNVTLQGERNKGLVRLWEYCSTGKDADLESQIAEFEMVVELAAELAPQFKYSGSAVAKIMEMIEENGGVLDPEYLRCQIENTWPIQSLDLECQAELLGDEYEQRQIRGGWWNEKPPTDTWDE
jgi:hypothetical protein